MPLLDHFHSPLSDRRQWRSFYQSWLTVFVGDLNRRLPVDHFAQLNLRFSMEVDITAFDPPRWTPGRPFITVPMTLLADIAEVEVYSTVAGPVLVGAIELVSPANKDRPATRDAFVSKCASLLQQAIGLVVVDIVTERSADLHAALLHRLHDATVIPTSSNLWAAAYRPWQVADQTQVDAWHSPLAVGDTLPSALPFWLKGGPCIPLDLEATYMHTCREQRIIPPANGSPTA